MLLEQLLWILDNDTLVRIENDVCKRELCGPHYVIEQLVESRTITNCDTVYNCVYGDCKLSSSDLRKYITRVYVECYSYDQPIIVIYVKEYTV